MKTTGSLGEFVTLLAKNLERVNTSNGTKNGSYINKNMVSEGTNWNMF